MEPLILHLLARVFNCKLKHQGIMSKEEGGFNAKSKSVCKIIHPVSVHVHSNSPIHFPIATNARLPLPSTPSRAAPHGFRDTSK